MSLSSDTTMMMPVAPTNMGGGYGNGGFGFGDNGAWWIIILFLFVFCGWGNNGFGNGNGSNGSGAMDNYVLASDFASLQRQIDSATSGLERKGDAIQSGLCDGFYAQNTTMLNGFSNAELSRANQQAALMQQLYTMSSNQQHCCCDTREAISGVNYNMATQSNAIQNAVNTGFCQTNYNNQNNTRDIVENANANTRAILDKLTNQELAAKDAQIAAQTQQIFGLQLAASQQAQNNYLVSTLRPSPIPAYPTVNPWSGQPYGSCGTCGTCGAA